MTPSSQTNNWFTQTSHKPYDRHHYQLHTKDKQTITFEDYEQLRAVWFQSNHLNMLSHVEVVDIKQKKDKGKGFM